MTRSNSTSRHIHTITHFLCGKDLWRSRIGAAAAIMAAILIWFVIDWASGTTFRALSDPLLWVNNLLATALLTLPFVITRRWWVHILMTLLVSGLLLANLMYMRTYLTAIPPETYLLAGNLADFTASISGSLRWLDLGFALVIIIACLIPQWIPATNVQRHNLRWLSITALLAAISAVWIGVRGGFYRAYDSLVQSCYYYTCGVPAYTVGGHIAYSLIDAHRIDAVDNLPSVQQFMHHRDSLGLSEISTIPSPRTNLVLTICESLESWVIGSQIHGIDVTPNLNRWAADSTTMFVPNVLTQVGAGRSIDCQLLVTAGLLPTSSSVYSMKYPANTYMTLPKAMRQIHGSRISMLSCDKPITWNQEGVCRAFGYDSLLHRSAWQIDEVIGNPAKLSDGSFLRQSIEKLKQGEIWPEGSPAMLTFITYSGHDPFRLPDKLRDPKLDVDRLNLPERLADYVRMAHYTDSQLPQLINYLRSRPDWDQTLVVIIGDHEGLGNDRESYRNSSPWARDNVSEGRFTPLIVLNAPTAGRNDAIVGQVDIYPTLLTMLGLEAYPWHGVGIDILSPHHPGAAYSITTKEVVGNTSDPAAGQLLREAATASDAIIRQNLLPRLYHDNQQPD